MYSPVPGASVSTPYARRGRHWSSGRHTGADFSAPTGSSVQAAVPGTVMSAGWGNAYGNLVKVLHDDGSVGYYAHLSQMAVKPGQRVQRGMWIGNVGSTGNSTGPHLHFEVRRKGRSVDPLGWLQADYKASSEAAGFAQPGGGGFREPFQLSRRSAPSTSGGGFQGTEFDIEEQLEDELPGDIAEAETTLKEAV